MNFCITHFNNLHRAIRHRGMAHLCTNIPDLIKSRARRWLQGDTALEEFDPLVVCMLELAAHAQRTCLSVHDCPLCCVTLTRGGGGLDMALIQQAADAMVLICDRNHIKRRQ